MGYLLEKMFFSQPGSNPSAVLCYNDLIAIGLINSLLEMGKRVPEDISVVGFDNIDIGGSVRIPLTTIQIPANEIGASAARLLIEQVEDGPKKKVKNLILPVQMIVRESAGKHMNC